MRLLRLSSSNELTITEDLVDNIPPYAILSHTWGADGDEVKFADLQNPDIVTGKAGYAKIEFCGQQARQDGIEHFWVDTCCIDKANSTELSVAITSMFWWYRKALKCYVYLSDVPSCEQDSDGRMRESSLHTSRWFTRGWTLQELLAPQVVEFYARDKSLLGTKAAFAQQIHEITGVPVAALGGATLSNFSVDARLQWAAHRETTRTEDKAYCLFGIFGIFLPVIYGEGDNASHRLREAIRQQFGASQSFDPMRWCVPRSRSPIFTGRQVLLDELERTVRRAVGNPRAESQCRIVISGIGGQGKSELCLQLAHRLRYMFWAVLWIDVSTASIAEAMFLDAARRLSLPSNTMEDARLGFSYLEHPWLLVLDNADEHIDCREYFPDRPLCVVLMTSRNEICHRYATVAPITLPGLEEEDALSLLLRAAGVQRDRYEPLKDEARAVARLLQLHALSLVQAGAYISRGHCTFQQYPRAYEEQRRQLLMYRPTQAQLRYGDVYTTFETSADAMKAAATQADRDALDLLHLLSTCSHHRLPVALFHAAWDGAYKTLADKTENFGGDDDDNSTLTSWHTSQAPSFLNVGHPDWNSFRLLEALNTLKSFSLVSLDNHENLVYISMHPLVHTWARERQTEDEFHDSWLQTGCTMALALKKGTVLQQDRQSLGVHIEALVSRVTTKMFMLRSPALLIPILVRCGWGLASIGARLAWSRLMSMIFECMELDSSRVEATWVQVYDLEAFRLELNRQLPKALNLQKQIVEIRTEKLAEDHPDRLESLHELAMAYQENGQISEAINLLEQVVQIRERTLAEDHPDRLGSQYELAMVYRGNGQIDKAVSLLERVVQIHKETLAEDHPRRLGSQHELAAAYRGNGQADRAVNLLEREVQIRERTLAEDHPDRLESLHELAIAYHYNGQTREAISLLERVVQIRERILAEDDPDQLAAQHMLALAYRRNEQIDEAINLLEQVVQIQSRTLAEGHPDRLVSQRNLALAYRNNGEAEKTIALLEQIVKVVDQTLAKDDPARQESRDALAEAYEVAGQAEKTASLHAQKS